MLPVETKLRSLPELRHSRGPHLPVLDTQELIDNMPAGRWEIPQEPYTILGRINENDLDFMKAYKVASFQENCRELIAEWIPFLGSVEKGIEINRRFIREGILTTDLPSIENCNFFYRVFAPKFARGELKIEEVVLSVRKAFLYLLTEEEAKNLGHEKPTDVAQDDIENAIFLVNRLAGRQAPIPPSK